MAISIKVGKVEVFIVDNVVATVNYWYASDLMINTIYSSSNEMDYRGFTHA